MCTYWIIILFGVIGFSLYMVGEIMQIEVINHTKWKELKINGKLKWESMDYNDDLIELFAKMLQAELKFIDANLERRDRGMSK